MDYKPDEQGQSHTGFKTVGGQCWCNPVGSWAVLTEKEVLTHSLFLAQYIAPLRPSQCTVRRFLITYTRE
jgi:hypothetical protein